MFRNDICTIKRRLKAVVEGETLWGDYKTIAADIPCHLSVKAISALNQSQSTATVMYDFTLFYDTSLSIDLQPNDVIFVKTAQGQEYKLTAGESRQYYLTTQTHCEELTGV